MARSTKLAELIVNETSGVDHPAHLHEGWLVIKSANTDQGAEVDLNLTEQHTDTEKAADADDVRKELTDLRKQLDEIRKEKETLVAERELEKAAETAGAWAILPGLDPQAFAASLVELRKALPAVAETVENVLSASARALSEAGILKEIGTSAKDDNAGDAWAKVEGLANDLVAAGEAKTFAKAVTIVAERNKDLYNQYLTEKGL